MGVQADWVAELGEALAQRRARMVRDVDWIDACRQMGAAIVHYRDTHEGQADPASFRALIDAADGEVERAHLLALHDRMNGA